MSIKRLLLIPVAALAAAACAASAPAGDFSPARVAVEVPAAAQVFVLTGGGWGHGVGMSQWGAYGQAQAGRTFSQILATYYPGTELEKTGKSTVRVLLADGVEDVAVSGDGPVVVEDATGRRFRARDGRLALDASLTAPLGPRQQPVTLIPPIRIRPVLGVHLSYAGTARRGAFQVQAGSSGLMLVNELPMESYLRGVVPGEMPVGWPLEALRAQAVAARTYAITNRLADKPFDLYADVRSQVYGGIPVETEATDRAVLETSGQILTYEGAPARTYYFSSSGGRTASALDVFGMDVPYLRSVDDPWDAVSPLHAWPTRSYTPATLARAFGLATAVSDVVQGAPAATAQPASVAPSPALVQILGEGGALLELTRNDVRSRLRLASTSFRFGVLALQPPLASPRAGGVVTISGLARDVDEPVLEKQRPDGTWQTMRRLRPMPGGSFSLGVRPVVTSVYRVSGSGTAGPTATVVVSKT